MWSRAVLSAGIVFWLTAVAAAADLPPLKIGWLMGYTGPSAGSGASADAALEVFFKKYGKTVAGREVVLIRRDTTGPAPDVAKRLAQELIVRDKVDIIAGLDYTPNAMAVGPLSTSSKTPVLIVNAATSGILTKQPYMVRFGFTTASVAQQMATYAVEQKIKSVYTLVHDFGPGLDAEAVFVHDFKAGGGTIVGSVRVPLNNTDFSAYAQKIKDASPEAIFAFMAAGDLPPIFLRQLKEAGLDSKIRILGTGDIVDEYSLAAAGDAALGVVTAFHYTPSHDSALNKEFSSEYARQAGGRPLNFIPVVAYDVMHAIYQVVELQGGNIDPDKTMALLKGLKFESPRGPIEIDPETRDIVQNIYFRRVEKHDGVLVNVEFATVPHVKDPGVTR
jgi:branched-chain amino acid transport system substrate-binding protein